MKYTIVLMMCVVLVVVLAADAKDRENLPPEDIKRGLQGEEDLLDWLSDYGSSAAILQLLFATYCTSLPGSTLCVSLLSGCFNNLKKNQET
jgi:hypothetical protein